jgi:hypothetical protein
LQLGLRAHKTTPKDKKINHQNFVNNFTQYIVEYQLNMLVYSTQREKREKALEKIMYSP